ncbi:DUF6286 domain-containing protein [Pseudonocardia sp. HH130629-09]|uniref:DUF6286 domain-containing protein n=1 Tax=Pseudonocardia sp. HH130629-09 TaxID=1641402 RepID=UPI0006CB1B31|nr:DUF6286 domain-containing protein [Pseudonocardia sp. HH130629-09]ALE86112.1 hypothetical protein XF36_25700 [Pseudonocardia sp. HH130629-09]
MIRRPRKSLAAGIVALVLLALCVVVAVAVVQLLLGQQPILDFGLLGSTVAGYTGADVPVLVASGVVALVGLVLVVVALRPGTPTVFPLASAGGAEKLDSGITRRSLNRSLADAATDVDGITKASVKNTGRRAAVTAHAAFGDPRDLRDRVRSAVAQRLDAVGPARSPKITVSVTGTKQQEA